MKGMHCVLTLGFVAICVAQAAGQHAVDRIGTAVPKAASQPAATTPTANSGTANSGTDVRPYQNAPNYPVIGFVPKHEKVLRQRSIAVESMLSPPTSSTERQSRPVRRLATANEPSAVQQASFEQASFDPVYEGSVNGCECPTPCSGMMCKFPKLWGSAEYLYLWTNGVDMPSLVTTSPDGTAQTDAGVLPAATTLFGGESQHDNMPGGRFSLGMWLNPQMSSGVEATYMFASSDESFRANQNDFAILARPFFNVDLGEEDSRLIAFQDLVEGNVSIDSEMDFESFEVNIRRLLYQQAGGRSDLIFGYRRARLEELLRIEESTTSLDDPTLGDTFELFDQFDANNEFHGGQIGIEYMGPAIRCWSLGLLAKVAFGYNNSDVDITGQRITSVDDGDPITPLDVSTVDSGLLTQTSNIGSDSDDEFSTLSELGLSLHRRWACGFGVSVGYKFLHWGEVARAGEQIDLQVNPTQIPPGTLSGAARPARVSRRSDFMAHGITAGLEYRF